MKRRFDPHTMVILLLALLVRLLVWRTLPYRDWISDEGEYWGAATWFAQGRGFAFFDGWIWSRPPLYVLFLAAQIKLFGNTALWVPRLTQALLGVGTVWVVMRIGERLAPVALERRVALLAGWMMALSYSFATFSFLLLSETLFLLLFLGGVWALLLAVRHQAPTSINYRWLGLAGLSLGAAALTRAVILTWLPLVVLWVIWQTGRSHSHALNQALDRSWRWRDVLRQHRLRPMLTAMILLTLAVCIVVLPWTAYATARWGGSDGKVGLILVDTTGGYNFAFGALKSMPQPNPEGIGDENDLHDLLCGGVACNANQAARQAQAYALGWRWINAYPAGFVAKTGRELLDMVQIRYGGAERMRSGHTVGAVPAPHLLGLLLDDTLYMVALPLALLGLFRRQGRAGKGLVLTWLLYNVAVGALVFAINRFRQPLLPFVFIYAACALVQWRERWPSVRRQRSALLATVAMTVLILPSYLYWPEAFGKDRRSVWQETMHGFTGLRLNAQCRAMEQALARGEVQHARAMHDALAARYSLGCLAIINAKLLQAEGNNDAALAFMAQATSPDDAQQSARILMLEGDLLRRLGRTPAALERFVPRAVEVVNDTAWAWDNLNPPPLTRLEVGTGLDYGYVRGFYKREIDQQGDFRWSSATSAIRFPGAGTGRAQTLLLRVNGYTNDWRPTTITVLVNGVSLPAIRLSQSWQTLELALPATPAGAAVVVEFRSSVFVNGPQDLAERVRDRTSQPLRLLGFQLDWAELK